MANLYISVDSDRNKTVTRTGNKEMSCHIRGWELGIKVVARKVGSQLSFEVFKTSGSNGRKVDKFITRISVSE